MDSNYCNTFTATFTDVMCRLAQNIQSLNGKTADMLMYSAICITIAHHYGSGSSGIFIGQDY